VKKTTLTISTASAYTDALIQDARISGRILLAIQAQADSRRSAIQDGETAVSRSEAETTVQAKPASNDKKELQKEPDPEIQTGGDTSEAESTAPMDDPSYISWNPVSFASTKAALIEAETALGGTVNEAVLFIDPPSAGIRRLSDLSLGQIEAATTTWITGYAQLLRELGRRFAERGSGVILVVLLSGERDPLGAMAAGAIEALACNLANQSTEAYRLFTVRDESGQPELLARFIMKVLDEPPRDSTKLLRHGGRISLFGK
jgi:hypothetical protein